MICAWAEEGADALEPDGTLVHADAFPPERLVDTLGAGDTFNAAVIFALSGGGHGPGGSVRPGPAPQLLTAPPPVSVTPPLPPGQSLRDALTFGCRIAGKKCGIHGYDGIV